jgi:hypothetical protein
MIAPTAPRMLTDVAAERPLLVTELARTSGMRKPIVLRHLARHSTIDGNVRVTRTEKPRCHSRKVNCLPWFSRAH